MRTAVQRCSASIPRHLAAKIFQQRTFRATHATRLPQTLPVAQRQFHVSIVAKQEPAIQEARDDSSSEITRFAQLAERDVLHPTIVDTLTRDMKLETMTDVQSRTINQAIKGTDIIAQAKTGTGKTLAFLMPILQRIIKNDPDLAKRSYSRRGPRTTADDIRALIISPTRELAEQIAMEARRLVANTSVVVQTAVGGTAKVAGLRAIQRDGCHILVGTPGRLHDILTDEFSRVQAPDLDVLVFDEADRLLDAGFWPDIQDIMKILPDPEQRDRQTLMFSATVPREVVDLVRRTLKPGFDFVQCVAPDEEPTHTRVPQHIVVAKSLENIIPSLVELCSREIEAAKQPDARPFKAIVYFSSTAEVTLAQAAMRSLESTDPDAAATSEGESALSRLSSSLGSRRNHPFGGAQILEIHAKLSQSQRTRAADTFREAKSGILLSSDVTARGLDFPNVTHVIQVGCASSQEQYVHRIGRTARAGKEGQGWLFVPEFDLNNTRSVLGRLPLKRDDTLEIPKLSLDRELQVSANAGKILSMTQQAMKKVSFNDKIKVYRAMLGVFQRTPNKTELIARMNALSQFGWGLREPPMIPSGLASKLRIDRVPGVRIGMDPRETADRVGFGQRDDRDRGRGGSFGGRGGSFGGRGDSFGGRSDAFGDRGNNTGRGSYGRDSFGGSSSYGRSNSYGGSRSNDNGRQSFF